MTSCLPQLPPPPPGSTGWPWTEETPPSVYAGRTDWPRISIVTPSYNQGAFIEETLRSILLQNYPNLQLIVMDGGSTDGTTATLQRYAPWLSHWESEQDRGQSHAINKGLARCDGEWFNWINSDDCLLPGALAAVAYASDGFDVVSGAQSTGATLRDAVPLGRTRFAPTLEDTIVNHFICQQGLFFRTSTIKRLHGVREELHYIMDLDLLVRVLLEKGLAIVSEIPATVAFFRRHDQAKTTVTAARFFEEERRVMQGLARALDLDPALLKRMAGAEEPIPAPAPHSRLDRGRFSAALGLKFWWNGVVEIAWLRRDFVTFKQEVFAFTRRLPEVSNQRITRLRRLACLPTPLLKGLSLMRTNPRDSR